jgi:hypothetical protein
LQRRNEKKKHRVRKGCMIVPPPTSENYYPNHKVVNFNTHITEPNGGILIRCFRGVVPQSMLDTISAATEQFVKSCPPAPMTTATHDEQQRQHGECVHYHLGYRQKNSAEVHATEETENKHSREWLHQNRELFVHISNIIKEHFPQMHAMYQNVKMPEQLLGVFATVALNLDFVPCLHKDKHDESSGYVCLMPFGQYEGGSLSFPALNMEVILRPGDFIFFNSALLRYYNEPYTGVRNTVVFFTDEKML